MPSIFNKPPTMKNPWDAKDLDRLVWKTLDLAADAVTSLRCVRTMLAAVLSVAETVPPPPKRPPRRKTRTA
jgi:hypothetical protein